MILKNLLPIRNNSIQSKFSSFQDLKNYLNSKLPNSVPPIPTPTISPTPTNPTITVPTPKILPTYPALQTSPTYQPSSSPIDLTSNWNKLTSYSISSSDSSSSSSSRSGLRDNILPVAENQFKSLTGYIPQLWQNVLNATPNQNVLNSLANLNKLALQNWELNNKGVLSSVFNNAITSLANRGVLDSSVAKNILSNIAGNYYNNLAQFQNQLEMDRINKALAYPMQSLDILRNLAALYGDLSRVSTSSSSSSSSSNSYSYNPSPAIGLLTSLIGI